MIVVPWPRKNEACMCRCVGIFFLGTTCVGFFHGWSPPSRFRYHRPRIASSGDQLGPVSWPIEHIAFVSYCIASVGMCNQFSNSSAQIPACRIHNMMCRFRDFASPTPKAAIPPQGAHIATRLTHSVSVLLIWVLLSSRSAIATATRTWRREEQK